MSEEKMIPIADFVEEMVAKADCTKRQDCQGFTGFRSIDNLTNGMKKGGLILLAARPGVGKSTLASNIAGNMAIDCRRRVAFFCMEMGSELFAQSIVCSRAHVKGSALRNNKMTSAEKDRITAIAQIVKDAPLYIDERRDWNVAELVDTVREMNKEKKLDLVIVDYLQLVISDKGESREEKLENVARGLKALANELHIPIIVTAMLSRHNEKGAGHLKPEELREIGLAVQQADSVWILDRRYMRTHRDEDKRLAELYVDKKVILLKFFSEYLEFCDMDEEEKSGYLCREPEDKGDRG